MLKTQKDIECKRTLGEFTVLQAGAVEGRLPDRVVRLALVHRLANTLAGVGRLSPQTARAVVDLQDTLPPVPSKGLWSSGEVMACSWLLAPLKDLPILPGEGKAVHFSIHTFRC